MYWNIDPKMKKKMLHSYVKRQEPIKYTIGCFIGLVLNIVGIVLFILIGVGFNASFIMSGGKHGALDIWSTVLPVSFMGIFSWFVPAIIAYGIRKRVTFKAGWPYSEREKEFIHLEKAGVEFVYYDVSREIKESRDLYQICYKDIRKLEYNEEIMLLTITGAATLTTYDNFFGGRINFGLSGGRLHSESKYSFILATQDAKKIIDEICNHVEPYVAQIYRGEEVIL